jgi:prepilin-type N-terminal cleavage/methylation domain-containing protein
VSEYLEDRKEQGFTLIELLIAIVVVGILTAVAIVGIAGLTNNGTKSSCAATQDAVRAAEAVFYANSGGKYPLHVKDMDGTSPKDLELTGGANYASVDEIDGNGGWHLVYSVGDGSAPLAVDAVNTKGC